MTTVADELLNDFEDSEGEDGEDNFQDGDDAAAARDLGNGSQDLGESMNLDGGSGNEDEGGDDKGEPQKPGAEAEDEADAKSRVEGMKLGGVSDVRSVAKLMGQLEPVLKVGSRRKP